MPAPATPGRGCSLLRGPGQPAGQGFCSEHTGGSRVQESKGAFSLGIWQVPVHNMGSTTVGHLTTGLRHLQAQLGCP